MLTQGTIGPITTSTSISPGLQAPTRLGNLGDAIVSELHGRYYETSYRRALFSGSQQAASVTTAGVISSATSYTGLCLYNPIGNTFNAVINKVGVAFPVAPAAATIYGIQVGQSAVAPTASTAVTAGPKNLFINGASPTSGLYSAITFTLTASAVITHVLGFVGTVAAASTGQDAGIFDLEGGIIVPPGCFAAIYTSTVANTAGFLGSISWEEIPV